MQMNARPTLQHMCPMKGEWPSCLYFPHNQLWCHHERSLNRPLSKNILLSPSPSLLIFHLSLIALTRLPPSSPNSFGKTTFFLSSFHSLLSLHAPPSSSYSLSPFRFGIQAHSVSGSLTLIESAQVKLTAKSTRMFWLRRTLFKRWPFQNRSWH